MKDMSIEKMIPVIKEVVSQGGTIRFYPHGKSMLPMLREGIDSVMLTGKSSYEANDIVLYKAPDGGYSLHRIVKIKNGVYYISGDNQSVYDKIKDTEKIVAAVDGWYRDEEYVSSENEKYQKYIRKIRFIRPFRRIYRRIRGR